MSKFESVSILLPTLNETFSFVQTVETILKECRPADIHEFIAIVCERTEKESLAAIADAQKLAENRKIPLHILYQTHPFAGGAVRDGMDFASGSHTIMMAPDLETDPHNVKDFIKMAKLYPNDMITG